MDSQTQYCLMRRDLEERVWRLTSRVPELTSELIMQIGPLSDMHPRWTRGHLRLQSSSCASPKFNPQAKLNGAPACLNG